jgi:hypothetical protein
VLSIGDPAITARPEDWWSPIGWLEGVVPVGAWWWLGAGASLCFAAGIGSRTSAAILFLVQSAVVHRNYAVGNGEDLVFRLLLFHAVFAGLGTAWSWEAWRRGRAARPPARWPLRLMQLNLALLYVCTQLNKLVWEPLWVRGEALYHVMAMRAWGRWPGPEPFFDPVVSAAATWGSLALELAFPIVVWIPRWRASAVLAVIVVHATIGLLLRGVTFFSLAMMVAALVFLTDADLDRLRAAWARRRAGAPRPVSRTVRWAVPAAAVASVVVAVLANVPSALAGRGDAWGAVTGFLRRHAYLVALDAHWQMFGELPRADWWLSASAVRADGSRERLSLPLRPAPTRLPSWFADAREPKLHLNLVGTPGWRAPFGRHLCRLLAARGTPARAVVLARRTRAIAPPDEAAAGGDHRGAGVETQVLETVSCPTPG